MDPEATLDQAEEALDDGDLETAIDRFEDYHQWRKRGGFQPSGGDARAKKLEAKLLRAHGKGLTGRRFHATSSRDWAAGETPGGKPVNWADDLTTVYYEDDEDEYAASVVSHEVWDDSVVRVRPTMKVGGLGATTPQHRAAFAKEIELGDQNVTLGKRSTSCRAKLAHLEAAEHSLGAAYTHIMSVEGRLRSTMDQKYDALAARLLSLHEQVEVCAPQLRGLGSAKRRGLRSACADAKREAERALRVAKTPAQRRAAQKFAVRVSERCAVDLRGMSRRRKKRRRR